MSNMEKLFETSYINQEVLQELSSDSPTWVKVRKANAYHNFLELDLDQDTLFYKYTNFKNFNPNSLNPIWNLEGATDIDVGSLKIEDVVPNLVEHSGRTLNFDRAEIEKLGGFFGTLEELNSKDEKLAKRIIEKSSASDRFDKLGELAKAFTLSTIILYLPPNAILGTPLFRRIMLDGEGEAAFSEIIIYLEEGASASYFEYYGSGLGNSSEQMYITSQTIVLDDNATFKMLSIQDWNDHIIHIGSKYANVGPYAKLYSLQQFQGSNLSRFNSGIKFVGRGSEGYDLFNSFGNHKQRFDFKSQLDHVAENTIGQTHSRTVMMNKAESILRGLIHIQKTGVNADSYLSSNGLTIGKGKVIAVPALIIDQNDVVAAHAASVEPLNKDKIFYISSRGIPEKLAEELLIKGYFIPVTKILGDERLEEISKSALSKKWEESKV